MKNSKLELIVGIPSYNEAENISFVTQKVDKGIQTYFPNLKSLIINLDNHSPDGTPDIFHSTPTQTPKHSIVTPEGVKGKGCNLINLFHYAKQHSKTLKVVLVVDADLRSITPEWIKFLAEPVIKGYDYSLPVYSRHQFDGTITNHICYPLIYGLLGRNLRQPIGGDFGFSPALLNYWLEQKTDSAVKNYGIDVFMTLHAIFGNFKICQAGLGAKIHKASAPKIGPMFTQVVHTLFRILLFREPQWFTLPIVKPEKQKRFGLQKLSPPQELDVNMRELKDTLRKEYYRREELLSKFLNEYAMSSLRTMFQQDSYHLDILMWTQLVYQLLFSYHRASSEERDDIVEALKPLYFARSVTFDYMTWRFSVKYAEEDILDQAKAFASQKPYLLGLYMNERINSLK